MATFQRLLLPAILAIVCVASSIVAVRENAEAEPVRPIGAVAPATPVLSARRVPSLLARPVGERRLRAGLDGLVARLPASSCLAVSDGSRRLFEHNPTQPLLGASTQKLLTATAALERLGGDRRLTTVAATAAPRRRDTIDGDLWLVGGGDPLLATRDYADSFERQPQLYTALEQLADRVAASGVRDVRGRVVGDASRYDNRRYVASWRLAYITDNDSGPLSALLVNDGFAQWVPSQVEDNVPAGDPAAHAAATLTQLLRQRGIRIAGEAGSGRAGAGVAEVASVASPPVTQVVRQMLSESDNTTAELLLKELGVSGARDGSTAAGAVQVARALQELRLPGEGAVVVDGSGLDRGNRVTCRLLSAVLEKAGADSPLGRGLAVAGQTGTLARRFRDTPVAGRLRAKTGSLIDVVALAGFLEGRAGERLTFAIVTNGVRVRDGRAFEDELAHLLVRYPEVPAPELLSPLPIP